MRRVTKSRISPLSLLQYSLLVLDRFESGEHFVNNSRDTADLISFIT